MGMIGPRSICERRGGGIDRLNNAARFRDPELHGLGQALDRRPLRGPVCSGYVVRSGAWKRMFHQQTPLPAKTGEAC